MNEDEGTDANANGDTDANGDADVNEADTVDSGDDGQIGGVVLAAGRSRRFGEENKLLATVDGTPLVVHAVRTLLSAALTRVVVVVGYEADRVEAALDDGLGVDLSVGADIDVRYNANYAAGQSTSVRIGARAADELEWDAAVFALGDMPWVDPETIDQLCAAYRRGTGSILAPSIDGQRGNPVLFGAAHFDALTTVTGDRGGRHLIESHDDAALIPVADPGIRRDVDEQADL
ncbi:nucleotidyltransferase family protein [Natronoglomus mannanivorans]|uniref:Nucleotidyltransferase family protein n=1 Tax=Natronoglomus mannanivorans TaxID=2979990 RepID=A0AAP2Z4Q1_9EURY|nr:nucleotidyltransferase family protein [Halobacteria archaeon AArc-xg1-1]